MSDEICFPVVSFGAFGSDNEQLYAAYLATSHAVASVLCSERDHAGGRGACVGRVGPPFEWRPLVGGPLGGASGDGGGDLRADGTGLASGGDDVGSGDGGVAGRGSVAGEGARGASGFGAVAGDVRAVGVSGVPLGPVIYSPGQIRRGPNYARNCANRARKKLIKEQHRQAAGVVSGLDGDVRRGKFDALPLEKREALLETHAERLVLENREKIAELEERALRRARGVNHLVETMKLLRLTKEAQDMEGLGSKADGVLGWAQTVASSLSESVARASSIGSFDSRGTGSTGVSAGSSASQGKQDFSSEKLRRTKFEQFLVTDLGWPDRRLVQVRTRVRRCLELKDVIGEGAVFSLSRKDQLAAISWVAGYDVECFR